MNSFKKDFISKENAKNLRTYKYKGSDESLLYKHIFSPLAQLLVDKVIPVWLAPNVITLLGFFCTLLPHFLIWSYASNSLSGPIPAWLCLMAGTGQILYMILDNADGKQARKTGSSSPLGLLFDHGCDAMNTFVSGLSIFTVLQLGNSPIALVGYAITFTVFFAGTWEEYYVGALNLPCFNGANEGVVGGASFFFISAIFGTDVWNTKLLNTELKVWVILFFVAFAVVTITYNCLNVHEKVKSEFWHAFSKLSVIAYLLLTMVIVQYLSTTNVISRTARIFVYFIGFSFSKLVGLLQATHCASEEFNPYRWSILGSATILNVHTIVGYLVGRPLLNEDVVVYACALFAGLAYIHFVLNIISQFTEVLEIKVFSIEKEERPASEGKEIAEEEIPINAKKAE